MNTGTNAPAFIHGDVVPGDAVEDFVVETVAKAGPAACPPLVVGVGGNFEGAPLLAKTTFLRKLLGYPIPTETVTISPRNSKKARAPDGEIKPLRAHCGPRT
jgi:tartrate dehydratase alpha subunit/fumarate hydratase class I-like protein